MKRKRTLIDGDDLEIHGVSSEHAETADMCVCMPWTDPPILADNLRATCADCGTALQHRPNAPKKPRKICVDCCLPVLMRGMIQ